MPSVSLLGPDIQIELDYRIYNSRRFNAVLIYQSLAKSIGQFDVTEIIDFIKLGKRLGLSIKLSVSVSNFRQRMQQELMFWNSQISNCQNDQDLKYVNIITTQLKSIIDTW